MHRLVAASLVVLALCGCATPYGSQGIAGGFSDTQLAPDVWRIGFAGNGYTTRETVQTYWLYHAADVTLAHGFDGFQVLSTMPFVRRTPGPVMVAAGGPVFVPVIVPNVANVAKPNLEGDIRLLKLPFEPIPGKVFNAAALKNQLSPIVNGDKCNMGNVCPHAHFYIYGDTPPPAAPAASPIPPSPLARP